MVPISVVVITYNEERNIGRCLDSVKDIADEIVVVDSFSADRTEEICFMYGVNFIQRKWDGYSSAKNFGNNQAKYDWILCMDADESLSDELRGNISEVKKNGLSGVYMFNRFTNYCGKWIYHCGWYPDTKIRIFRKQDAQWSNDTVHEKLILKKKLQKKFLKGDLKHYSYYTTDEHKEKAKKYAQLGSQKIILRRKNFLYLMNPNLWWRYVATKSFNGGIFIRMIFSPIFRFSKMYFFQLGFLDGYFGYKISAITSGEVFMKYKIALASDK